MFVHGRGNPSHLSTKLSGKQTRQIFRVGAANFDNTQALTWTIYLADAPEITESIHTFYEMHANATAVVARNVLSKLFHWTCRGHDDSSSR